MHSSGALLRPTELNLAADANITAVIMQLFSQEKGLNSQVMEVTTHEGVVHLTGFADTPQIRQRAEELVLNVSGVRGLKNLLHGSTDAPKAKQQGMPSNSYRRRGLSPDEKLTTQIWELLEYDSRVNGAQVQISTAGRVVTLTGTVATAAEKASLITTAYQAGAARIVSHNLQVAYWFAYRADDYLAQLVRDALHANPQLSATEPLVQVQEGTVTLAGVVETLRARQVAEQIALDVVGVHEVRNLLKVRTKRPITDEGICRCVVAALAHHVHVGRFSFRVSVRSGQVHLSGTVDTAFEQQQAGYVAAEVEGVIAVENAVEVRGYPGPGGLASFSLGSTAQFLAAKASKRPPFPPSFAAAPPAVGHFLLS